MQELFRSLRNCFVMYTEANQIKRIVMDSLQLSLIFLIFFVNVIVTNLDDDLLAARLGAKEAAGTHLKQSCLYHFALVLCNHRTTCWR